MIRTDFTNIPQQSQNVKLSDKQLSTLFEIFQIKLESKKATFEEKQQACFEKVLEACKEKDWEKIKASKDLLTYLTNHLGQTILLYAVSSGKTKLSIELIERQIALKSKDGDGNTALHIAAYHGDIHLLGMLWEHIPIDEKNNYGQPPLHTAIFRGQVDVVSALIRNVKNLSHPFNWKTLKITPLGFAALRGEIGCFEVLLHKVPFSTATSSVGTLLHLVVHFQQNEMLKHLLMNHSDYCQKILEEKNQEGLTPLALAVLLDNPDATSLLHDKGANIETQDFELRRPLHLAALNDNHFMIKYLVTKNCEITPRDTNLRTPHDLVPDSSSSKALLYNLMWQDEIKRDDIPQYRYRPPQNLVFKGGGVKGIAYIGALNVLRQENALSEVKRISGTSVGAITATLLAMNFPIEEIKDILSETPLSNFFDHNLPKTTRIQELMKDYSVLKAFRALLELISGLKNPTNPDRKPIQSLSQITGICKGNKFEEWIESQIYKKTRTPHCTFGELRNLILQNKPFKHLHVFAVQLTGKGSNLLRFNSEENEWDDVVISSAVRASMSIPGIFIPAKIKRKQRGHQPIPAKDLGSFVDGGITYNFPIEAFDEKQFILQGLSKEESSCPMHNKRTLGFSLVSSNNEIPQPESIKNLGQLFRAIFDIFYGNEDLLRQRTPYNEHRVIEIDTQDAGTLEFDLSEDKKLMLIEAGKKATEVFFKKQEGRKGHSLFLVPKPHTEKEDFSLKAHLFTKQNLDNEYSYKQACNVLEKHWGEINFEDIRNWKEFTSKAKEFYSYTCLLINHSNFTNLHKKKQIFFYKKSAQWKHLQLEYDKAQKLFQTELTIQQSLDPNHSNTALILRNIGMCFSDQHEFPKALEKYKEAYKLLQKTPEVNQPLLPTVLNDIGRCLLIQGSYKEALEKHQEALEIQKKAPDPNYPDIAKSLICIGTFFYLQNKYQEALEKYMQALEIQKKTLDSQHPNIANSIYLIGRCFHGQNQYPEALEKYQQALEIQKKALDSQHPKIASTLDAIAHCLCSQNKFKEAAIHFQKAYEIAKASLGNEHPKTKQYIRNLSR
ncbi:MAG: Photosystem I assembly protein Ycf3 [Chlamydiae bacterium]|nr:Photosystem I assembly protein Ycf3 [Chlamydiota bacterium]